MSFKSMEKTLVKKSNQENQELNNLNGETILTQYIKTNFPLTDKIKKLIYEGADINQANDKGETPLAIALKNNHYLRQKILSFQGDFRYVHQIPALTKQLVLSDKTMDLILMGADPKKSFSPEGYTFFGEKIMHLNYEHKEALKMILAQNKNKDLYTPDKNGNTPLHMLMLTKNSLAMFLFTDIIIENSSLNKLNNNNETALITGIKNNADKNILLDLIEKGTNVNIQDKNGNTALHLAIQKKNMDDIILALIAKGADFLKENNNKETPFMLAQSNLVKAFLLMLNENNLNKREEFCQRIKILSGNNDSFITIQNNIQHQRQQSD